ncbi:8-oxo-dGTP diphosphatase [Rossellomorea vietnamensis]|uniref:8-oxo-dGTP diphosphatase n=1 Tax=Rossellomorea vietnamensis TaxID=218284 RepID=A0A5D4MFD3_9BACI|nr:MULTISPECIES: 8-oxo-dGTP diphosphatase [Bacillaceae]TYS00287.1 8-oxo-dGTP diphosphatase [Rossellomorea vietnamensis]
MNWKDYETQLYTMVMIEKEGRLLLVERPPDKGFPGYIAPGGKIDFPESPAEGAEREVREETGLTVKSMKFKGIDEFVIPHKKYRYIVYNYLATELNGDLLDDPPEGTLKWISRKKVMGLPMQPWFKRRLPYFFKDGVFEIHSKWDGNESSEAEVTIREL